MTDEPSSCCHCCGWRNLLGVFLAVGLTASAVWLGGDWLSRELPAADTEAKPAASAANPTAQRSAPGTPPSTAESAAVPLSQTPADRWPLFRGGPAAQGVSTSSLPARPELLWRKSIPDESFEGGAAIAGDAVYLGGFDHFYALDLATGEVKWKQPSEAGFKAAPAVRDNRVYIGDLDGKFRCYDAADGKLLWEHATEAEIDSGANFYHDKVLVGSQDATLYCLDAASGKLVWKHAIADQIRCFPTIAGDNALIAGCDGELHVIDLQTGEARQSVRIEAPTGCTPAVLGDMAFVGTEGESFFGIDWKQGTVAWTYQHPTRKFAYRSSAAVTPEVVVVGNRGKMVLGLNPQDGTSRWIYNAGAAIDSSPIIVGQRAFFGAGRGSLLALDIATGARAWEYQAGGTFSASPAVAQGRLVIGNEDGTIYCFGQK